MKKALILLSAMMILSQPSLVSKERPIEFDDLLKMRTIKHMTPSPGGQYVAYTLYEIDGESGDTHSSIWITDLGTGDSKRLTRSGGSDRSPCWSPDGSKLAFISKRSEKNQIWILDMNGGEAEKLTNISTGAGRVLWSPDGSNLVFTSHVFPECPDDDCNRSKAEEIASGDTSGRLIDHLLYRHWNSWRDGKWEHLFVISTRGGDPIDLTPGYQDVPPVSLWGHVFAAFTPDGKHIVFPSNMDALPAASTNIDLFRVSTEGGEIEKLTENPANDNTPVFSSGGELMAYRAMARAGYESDRYTLKIMDTKTGKDRTLTARLDRPVGGDLCWAPDEKSFFFSTDDEGRKTIFQVNAADGSWRKLDIDGDAYGVSVSSDPPRLVFKLEKLNAPAEIFCIDLSAGPEVFGPESEPRKLTGFNDDIIADLDMNAGEQFRYEGAGGDSIQAWLVKPPGFSSRKKYPVVFLIHGGPQGAFTDEFHYRWNAQMFASPGYVVVMPNFRGSTGFGQGFTDQIGGDWGGKPYWDIMKCVDHISDTYKFVDENRIGAAGASYGGYMINWIEGHTDRFRCLVSHAGLFELTSKYGSTEELWFPEWEFGGPPWENPELYHFLSPSTYAANFKTPCLVVHGELDYRVPFAQGLGMFTALQRQQVPSLLLVFPDEDHFVAKPGNRRLWWKTVHGWLGKYLQ